MAMIDYGAIAWKDGKLISTEFFTPMKDTVGWDDEGEDTELKGNYFVYIGDKDFTIGFYKSIMRIYRPNADPNYRDTTVYFGGEPYEKWRRWRKWYVIDHKDLKMNTAEIIVRPVPFHDYYICEMDYRGHKYKVAFGYGVDLKYYKKTHIIDYYGTPWFKASSMIDDVMFKFRDMKYRWRKEK